MTRILRRLRSWLLVLFRVLLVFRVDRLYSMSFSTGTFSSSFKSNGLFVSSIYTTS